MCESYNKISDLNAPNLSDLTSECRPRLEQISDERQLIVHGPMMSSDVQECYYYFDSGMQAQKTELKLELLDHK